MMDRRTLLIRAAAALVVSAPLAAEAKPGRLGGAQGRATTAFRKAAPSLKPAAGGSGGGRGRRPPQAAAAGGGKRPPGKGLTPTFNGAARPKPPSTSGGGGGGKSKGGGAAPVLRPKGPSFKPPSI